MTHQMSVGIFAILAASILMMLLGGYVASRAPPMRANRLFGAVCILTGLGFVSVYAFQPGDSPDSLLTLVGAALFALAAPFIGWLAIEFPVPLPSRQRRALWVAALIASVYVFAFIASFLPDLVESGWMAVMAGTGYAAWWTGFFFAMTLLPLRHALVDDLDQGRHRPRLVTLGVGFVVWPAVVAGRQITDQSVPATFVVVSLALLAMVSIFWLRAGHIAGRRGGRAARNVGLLTLACVLAGSLTARLLPGQILLGMLLGTFVLLFAWGVLRSQLFDLDLRIKWTLRQGTLAAMFVGVFFVVSETAALLISAQSGPYVGIAVAGLLLFALAPLQSVAERLANRAMPDVSDTPEYRVQRAREIYVAAFQAASRDGVILTDERDVLAEMADRLGLTAGQARALERGSVSKGRLPIERIGKEG